jgi:hypothetical protein
MFRKDDLPSGKKEENLRYCLFELIQNKIVCPFDGLQEGPS